MSAGAQFEGDLAKYSPYGLKFRPILVSASQGEVGVSLKKIYTRVVRKVHGQALYN